MRQRVEWSKIFWKRTFVGLFFWMVLFAVVVGMVTYDSELMSDDFSGIVLPGDGVRGLLDFFVLAVSGSVVFTQMYSLLGSIWEVSGPRRFLLAMGLGAVLSAGFLLIYMLVVFNLDLWRDLGRYQTTFFVVFMFLGVFLVPAYLLMAYGWFRQKLGSRGPIAARQ
jgi:hypothetical protein